MTIRQAAKMTDTDMRDDEQRMLGLQQTLLRYCLSVTGSRQEAEDLCQEVWIRALERLTVQGHRNPEAFLLRIARNRWIDLCRRNALHMKKLKKLEAESERPGRDAGSGGLPGLEAVFGALVKHLTPLQRTVFVLRDALDYSIAETAAMLNVTEGAVKSALHRARHSLEPVKHELEEGEAAQGEEAWQWAVRNMAAAYENGDVPDLVYLLLRQHSQPQRIEAVGRFYSSAPHGAGAGFDLRMSA